MYIRFGDRHSTAKKSRKHLMLEKNVCTVTRLILSLSADLVVSNGKIQGMKISWDESDFVFST